MTSGTRQPSTSVLEDVERYYSARLSEHGPTARGVDWNGEESQFLRFQQLEKLLPHTGVVQVNDIGCGYGALLPYLRDRRRGEIDYYGCDISPAMVEAARQLHGGSHGVRFALEAVPSRTAEFGFSSGVFNVRLGRGEDEWRTYVIEMLDALNATSSLGFAFNCLTSYSDAEKMRPHLFYADPREFFDLCKRRYSRHVALLHDYDLYEFTMLIRKMP